jgi:hypothetical protein
MDSPMFSPTFHQSHKIWLEAIQSAATKNLLSLVSLRFIPSINITQPEKIKHLSFNRAAKHQSKAVPAHAI